jgi:erythromycin esterase-like protein
MHDFNRWPTWMWANTEVAELAKWMRSHNSKSDKRNLGFYGLDVYSLWESMEEVVRYLDRTDSPEAEAAKKAFACFEPFQRDSQTYGVSAAYLSESCENEVVALLSQIQARRKFLHQDDEASVSLEINTMVAANAERYYRSMVRGGLDSWNIRDHHMVTALERLLLFYGPTGKAIVWEHNTHIGDARATDMAEEGMVNVGQLLRERYNRQVFAIGFGTHRGTVVAAKEWGDPLKRMIVPPAQHDSWEGVMHRAGDSNKILLLGSENPYF